MDVKVDKFRVLFTQEMDTSCSDLSKMEDKYQFLSISVEDVTGNEDFYYVLGTERWAFESIEDLQEIVRKFQNMLAGAKV